MKTSKDILSSVVKTAQMGQIGIRSVLNTPLDESLQSALRHQLRTYDTIEREAMQLAGQRGWTPDELDPGIRAMTNMMTRMRLSFGDANSKAAAMMIRGNNRGLIKGHKNINNYLDRDPKILAISQRLMDCEEAGIHQMQGFL